MNTRQLYWVCQLLGWGGMVMIELVNYTFFIAGQFYWPLVSFFVWAAVVGVVITDVFRRLLKRTELFSRGASVIWLAATGSSLLLAVLMTILTVAPNFLFAGTGKSVEFTWIEWAGRIINWSRYVGVWVILYFMYRLLERHRLVERERAALTSAAMRTELELLKSQLNPHFLFNALNSIKALVAIDPEKSKDAIVKLSELLRFSLNYQLRTTIPLREELAELEKYLTLEQTRFGPRLVWSIEAEPAAQAQPVPPALLLTLAENAIKHGVSREPGPCEIMVRAHWRAPSLHVQMQNTGRLASDPSSAGIGLKTIRKRLQSIFGERAQFTLVAAPPFVNASIELSYTSHAHTAD